MSGVGALGAFLGGMGDGIQLRRNRDERAAQRAQNDRLMSIYEQQGAGMAIPMGAIPMGGGGAADSGQSAARETTFQGGGNRDSFVEAMMPHALRVSQETGLDPRLIIAQAAQETGWGRSAPNNNFFGVKSHGRSGGGTFATTEYVDGKPVTINDSFRGYANMGESADDYGRFLRENPRYKPMLSAQGLDAQIEALGQSGYATDPNYARSVASIANSIVLPAPQPAPTVADIRNRVNRPMGATRPQ